MRLQSGQPVDRRFRCSRICNFGRMRLRSTLPQPRGNPHLKSRRSGSGVGRRSPSCSTLFNFSGLSVVLSGTFWPLRWQGEQEESSGNDPLAISGDPLFFRGVWNDYRRPVHCRLQGKPRGPSGTMITSTRSRLGLPCVSVICCSGLDNPSLKTRVESGSSPRLPVQFLYPRG